jgi:hypothetical protein
MSKYLLREFYELCDGGVCQDFLTEAEKKLVKEGKATFLTGVMQRYGVENGNRRVYPEGVLRREAELYSKLVKERRALGELDHPDNEIINLANASHLVTEVWWQENALMGKVQVLDTPSGQILSALVQSGVTLGISSRGLGSVSESQGQTIVEDDFQLICFDFVSEPSTPGAFMMAEGKNLNLDKVFTQADRINRALDDILRNP